MVDDFSLRDLRDPQAPRVRRILSALINFHLFEAEQAALIDGLEQVFEHDENEKIRISDLIEEWKNKIAAKRAEQLREADEDVALGKENMERRTKLIRAKEMEEPALTRLDAAKRERATLQEKMEIVTMILKQHDGEITRLRNRVVQSPDRVRQTLNDMAKSLQSLKDELIELDRKGREHESRIQVLKKYEMVRAVFRVPLVALFSPTARLNHALLCCFSPGHFPCCQASRRKFLRTHAFLLDCITAFIPCRVSRRVGGRI